MPNIRINQTDFSSGVLDPRIWSRTDVKHYYSGVKTGTNVLSTPQGGLKRRPGSRFVKDIGEAGILYSYKLSESEHRLLAFYDDGAGGVDVDIFEAGVFETTIAALGSFIPADITELTFAASAAFLIIFHKERPSHFLYWTGAAWAGGPVVWTHIPQVAFTLSTVNSGAITMTPSATSGTIRVTASAAFFLAADPGGYLSFNGGQIRISKFVSTTVVEGYVIYPFIDLTATTNADIERGYEDAWSSTRGYPRCGVFHQGRLYIGGTRDLPETTFGSRFWLPSDFNPGIGGAADAVVAPFDTDTVIIIRHLKSTNHLQVFTDEAEFYVRGEPITQGSFQPRLQDKRGIGDVSPVFIDGATVFLEGDSDIVREFLYADLEEKYSASNISIFAQHLIRSAVTMAHKKPHGDLDMDLVYVGNGDGTFAILNTLREQKHTAWTEGLISGGEIISFAYDKPYMYGLMRTTVDSVVKYNVIEFREDFRSDDSILYDNPGTPITTVTGLASLEGETVWVQSEGRNVPGDFVVSGGEITIPVESDYIIVGRPCPITVKLLPPNRDMETGALVSTKRRVTCVTMFLIDTWDVKVNGRQVPFQRFGEDVFNPYPPLFTGLKRSTQLGSSRDHEEENEVIITQDVPQPFYLASVTLDTGVHE